MSIARVRVEMRRLPPNQTRMERERSTIMLLRAFKRACNEAGIMHDYKEHEYFVRRTDKRRRKRAMRLMAARQEWGTDADKS